MQAAGTLLVMLASSFGALAASQLVLGAASKAVFNAVMVQCTERFPESECGEQVGLRT